MPDFQRLSKKFLAGRAGLEDVVRVYQAVSKLPNVLETLSEIGRAKARDVQSGNMEWAITDEAVASLMDEHYCNSLAVRTLQYIAPNTIIHRADPCHVFRSVSKTRLS